jgi:hypothetical protein
MMGIITTVLGLIPGLSSLVTAFTNAYFNSKVRITTAQIGGDTTVATQLVKAAAQDYATNVDRLKVYASSKWLLLLIFIFALPFGILEWKVIVWDTVLGWGVTNPVRGEIGSWGHIIIMCLFGSGTSLAVGHLYFSNKSK